ncbi:tyrosine--tRNA ligase [Striga asiatica]|uniref:Tyrosine--tRNA ligase n=1 Tax=Striga asiatica TaxID=4170 RepID=A0A5A7Q805_STRAF|nr:tyrosine--tRNA ligase [Striga asiatica]
MKYQLATTVPKESICSVKQKCEIIKRSVLQDIFTDRESRKAIQNRNFARSSADENTIATKKQNIKPKNCNLNWIFEDYTCSRIALEFGNGGERGLAVREGQWRRLLRDLYAG